MKREVLKQARKGKGMTQQAVADYLGIGERLYKYIESGQRTGNFKIWDALEDLFGIHQRVLREIQEKPHDSVSNQSKRPTNPQ